MSGLPGRHARAGPIPKAEGAVRWACHVFPACICLKHLRYAERLRARCGLDVPAEAAVRSRCPTMADLAGALADLSSQIRKVGPCRWVVRSRDSLARCLLDYAVDSRGAVTGLRLSRGQVPWMVLVVERLSRICGPLVMKAACRPYAALITPGADPMSATEILRDGPSAGGGVADRV
jgi:hypothetical protein